LLNGLDLFSGIGGLSLALSPWVRPIAYCENDRYAQGVLLSRMASGELPPALCERLESLGTIGLQTKNLESTSESWWEVEPDVGRVVDGLPNRLDRIKCLGNAVVPQQAREAFRRLMGL
jgi:hypothetical protein